MTECKINRWFYKFTDEDIKNYTVKNKENIKIITRLNPDFNKNIQLFQELFPNCKMAKRIRKDTDPECVKKYNWCFTPYDNTGYGDEYNFISFIIIKGENLNELFDIIKSNFTNHFIRKSSPNTYTLKIDPYITTRGVWRNRWEKTYGESKSFKTRYPIAILSFGRYNDAGKTHKLLTKLKIIHNMFVEPFEYDLYEKWYDKTYCHLIKAPKDFHLKNMGSTPMRNYILKHIKCKNECWDTSRVWLLDDNIKSYKRLFKGVKNTIEDVEIFTSIENYIQNYNNVGIVSHNFNPFVVEGGCRNVFCKNGKCYSSMLVPTNTDIKFKHKHQEDNFISIEYICAGYTNLCFNHICYDKNTSGVDEGGNNKFIYKKSEEDIGRKERYEYSLNTAETLIQTGEIKLKDNKVLKDFIFHKPLKHEYWHCEFNYAMLKNYDNDIDFIEGSKIEIYNNRLYLDTGDPPVEDKRTKLMKLSKEELIELILNKNI